MNTLATILLLIGIAVFAVAIVRIVGRIVSWRLTLVVLAIAILTATGLLNLDPILAEIGYATSNLFGGTP